MALLCQGHSSAQSSIADPDTQNSVSENRSKLDTVTVEARKQSEIKSQISKFVAGAVFTYLNDSLERWDTPICPLVAGLPREGGEFVLARLSEIARDSHAPLGPEHCRPNLYVVITDDPDFLLEKWSSRDPHLFNTCNGMGYVRDFLHSKRPVRAYYNARFASGSGEQNFSALALQGLRLDPSFGGCVGSGAAGTRLRFGAVQQLTSVIVVVDSRYTTNLNMGQLADYVAMVGLAQIRLDRDTGSAPTILHVFQGTDPQVQGLSPWDRAFLYGLYTTSQSSVLEVTTIKRVMFERITGH
jgi:hypothetical protein